METPGGSLPEHPGNEEPCVNRMLAISGSRAQTGNRTGRRAGPVGTAARAAEERGQMTAPGDVRQAGRFRLYQSSVTASPCSKLTDGR